MTFALLVALLQTQAATRLVQIQNLPPREQRVSTFVLSRAQDLTISAIGAEPWPDRLRSRGDRSEEHTSELQSQSFMSYAVFCLKKMSCTCAFPFVWGVSAFGACVGRLADS